MSAARYFYKAYSPKKLNQIYEEKIQYRASAGMDNITPKVFEAHLTDNPKLLLTIDTLGQFVPKLRSK